MAAKIQAVALITLCVIPAAAPLSAIDVPSAHATCHSGCSATINAYVAGSHEDAAVPHNVNATRTPAMFVVPIPPGAPPPAVAILRV